MGKTVDPGSTDAGKAFDNDYRISGVIENADDFKVPVRVTVVEWDRDFETELVH